MTHDEKRRAASTAAAEPPADPRPETAPAHEGDRDLDLDVESLDLTVERVEERISPSETNVFDK